ncbi:MAG: DUF805 domain-containing protein [Dysgonamonadaceae bacterium]|jgi:uncharacterized membrane protein YhaH (DUF805 family)|nr:DUF805 domain-containing protein [Dysgonamonadaceae bacterium]
MKEFFTKLYLKLLYYYPRSYGRASRKEYWLSSLFSIAFIFAFPLLFSVISDFFTIGDITENETFMNIGAVLFILMILVVTVKNLAVAVRRLHDVGKSGWWLLIFFVPFGIIWLLVLFLTDSQPGSNKYGENPKGVLY